jgi:hypothetical protein
MTQRQYRDLNGSLYQDDVNGHGIVRLTWDDGEPCLNQVPRDMDHWRAAGKVFG